MTHHDVTTTLEALSARRDEIIRWAAQELVDRLPDLAPERGKRGLLYWKQDLGLHVRHVHRALLTGDPGAFATYVRWLVPTLAMRGMSLAQVRAGLELLRESVVRHLAEGEAAVVVAVIDGALGEILGEVRG